MDLAPIALFAYNRPDHLKGTVNSLLQNSIASESELWIFSDAPKNNEASIAVSEVRSFLKSVKGFKKIHIIEREQNYGLGKNIIEGVTSVVSQYGKIIVLEDDLITSPYFLQFMNDGLTTYQNEPDVISVHGYLYPVTKKLPETFFVRGADCLGWGTWKRAWELFEKDGAILLDKIKKSGQSHAFDFNGAYPYRRMLEDQVAGKNNSWAVRWYASAFINNKFTLYPGRSLVFHAGGDGSGVNTGFDEILNTKLSDRPIHVVPMRPAQNDLAVKEFGKVLAKLSNPPLIFRIRRKLKKLWNQKSVKK